MSSRTTRRPGSLAGPRGVVAFRGVVARVAAVGTTALLLAVAGCGNAVEVETGDLSAEDRERCAALVADLPDELFGQERRDVEPEDAPAAAWGDPAAVLVCGVDQPAEYDQFSSCTEIGGTGWFMPDTQLRERGGAVEITAMSHSPRVQLVVPPELRGEGADSALAQLGPLVDEHLVETLPCH